MTVLPTVRDQMRHAAERQARQTPSRAPRRRGGPRFARLGRTASVSGVLGIVVAVGVLAVAGVFVMSLRAARPRPSTGVSGQLASRLPLAQLVALARGSLAGLGDPHVSTALVVRTRKNEAENWLEPGAVLPGPTNPTAYVIVLTGRFTCSSCSYPAGASPPRGRSAQSIWVPGVGANDGGLTARTPGGLDKLGRVITISLTTPSVSANELALRPGSGIGPISLGASLLTLNRQLGPALSAGDYVVGPIQVISHPGRDGRVDQLATFSPPATIDGHRLDEGYARLQRELTGWQALRCATPGHITVLAHTSAGGISTRLVFDSGSFAMGFIGKVQPGTCEPPTPNG